MDEQNLPQVGGTGFEELKQTNDFGAEYWTARGLQSLPGYRHWRGFEKAIQESVTFREQSGNEPGNHFAPWRRKSRKPRIPRIGRIGQSERAALRATALQQPRSGRFRETPAFAYTCCTHQLLN